MSKKDSRTERKKQERSSEMNRNSGLSRIYYYVIGFLFVVLLGLIIFIFTRDNDKVNLQTDNENGQVEVADDADQADTNESSPANEEAEETNEEDSTSEGNTEESEEPATDEETEENAPEEEVDDVEPGESTVVDEDAPHDSSYAIDFSDGSADRVAIKSEIIAATGLGNDLTEWWIGNNGPGRVEATVSSRDQAEIYRVYLQYGNGSWHVTSYERLTSLPND